MKFIKNSKNYTRILSNNLIKNIYKIIIVFALSCFPAKTSKEVFYHLIIDAGSSGTRFCPYQIYLNQNHCTLKDFSDPCISINSKNGLADLSKEEIHQTLDKGFDFIFLNYKSIDFISLLGTGGFRKLNNEERKEKLKYISEYFLKIPITTNIKLISGEEEAYFAWKSIEILYNSKNHNIIETGGATIQFAYIDENKNFHSISLPIGMNRTYENLIKFKEFQENCKYGLNLNSFMFEFCKNFIKEKIYEDPNLKNFIKEHKRNFFRNTTYTSGTPWYTIFTLTKSKEITIDQLKKYGENFCSKTQNEFQKENSKDIYTDKNCYLFYYHLAQLESLQISQVSKGIQSWTLGASVSQKSIPYCLE